MAASGLSADQIGNLIDTLASVIVEVHPSYLGRAQLRDPNDDMVLKPKALSILKQAGKGNPPVAGDELVKP